MKYIILCSRRKRQFAFAPYPNYMYLNFQTMFKVLRLRF